MTEAEAQSGTGAIATGISVDESSAEAGHRFLLKGCGKGKGRPGGRPFLAENLSIFRIPGSALNHANFVGAEGLWNQRGHESKGLTKGAGRRVSQSAVRVRDCGVAGLACWFRSMSRCALRTLSRGHQWSLTGGNGVGGSSRGFSPMQRTDLPCNKPGNESRSHSARRERDLLKSGLDSQTPGPSSRATAGNEAGQRLVASVLRPILRRCAWTGSVRRSRG